MAQWWQHSPPTNVARVRFPDLASHVGWVCFWFSSLLREVFLQALWFSPLLKNQHFQIPVIQFGFQSPRLAGKTIYPHSLRISEFIWIINMIFGHTWPVNNPGQTNYAFFTHHWEPILNVQLRIYHYCPTINTSLNETELKTTKIGKIILPLSLIVKNKSTCTLLECLSGKILPPPRVKSPTCKVVIDPLLAGKGGGVSEDSSWTVLPFLAGSKGGMSQYSGSLLSLESKASVIMARQSETGDHITTWTQYCNSSCFPLKLRKTWTLKIFLECSLCFDQ